MTRKEFNEMSFEKQLEYATYETGYITSRETLKEKLMNCIYDEDYNLAMHILKGFQTEPYDCEYYRYEICMGTLEEVTGIESIEDVEDIFKDLIFEEE